MFCELNIKETSIVCMLLAHASQQNADNPILAIMITIIVFIVLISNDYHNAAVHILNFSSKKTC